MTLTIRPIRHGVIEVDKDTFSEFNKIGLGRKVGTDYFIEIILSEWVSKKLKEGKPPADQFIHEQYSETSKEVIQTIDTAIDQGYDMLLIKIR